MLRQATKTARADQTMFAAKRAPSLPSEVVAGELEALEQPGKRDQTWSQQLPHQDNLPLRYRARLVPQLRVTVLGASLTNLIRHRACCGSPAFPGIFN